MEFMHATHSWGINSFFFIFIFFCFIETVGLVTIFYIATPVFFLNSRIQGKEDQFHLVCRYERSPKSSSALQGKFFRSGIQQRSSVEWYAIQRFFDGNIWSPLGAQIDFLFLRGVVGATDGLCDWFASPASWFVFEPERPEEIDVW